MIAPCCLEAGPADVEFDDELGRDGDFWRPGREEAAGPLDGRASGILPSKQPPKG